MDLGTIVGFAAGTLLIAIAIALGGAFSAFLHLPSLCIVLGGSLSAACVMFPADQLLGAVKVAAKAFRFRRTSPERLIRRLVAMAEVVRREGLLALEKEELEHEFLRRGLNLAIDGTDSDTIDTMLVTEIQALRRRHQQGQKIFRALGMASPAFGMIGTLIGLVQMLQQLDDPSAIGPAMAVALLTTLYGAVLANLVFLPIASKLEQRSSEEVLVLQIIAAGIRSVTRGDYPRLTQTRLEAFLAPRLRTRDEEELGSEPGSGAAVAEADAAAGEEAAEDADVAKAA